MQRAGSDANKLPSVTRSLAARMSMHVSFDSCTSEWFKAMATKVCTYPEECSKRRPSGKNLALTYIEHHDVYIGMHAARRIVDLTAILDAGEIRLPS